MPTLLDDSLAAEAARIRDASARGRRVVGLPSGLARLDAITGGFVDGELTLLAARPLMGKTALAFTVALNVALRTQSGVALLAPGVNAAEAAQRAMAMFLRAPLEDIRKCQLRRSASAIDAAVSAFRQAPVLIDNAPLADERALDSRVRSAASTLGRRGRRLELLIVDSLQDIAPAHDGIQGSGRVVQALKSLARDMSLPILATTGLTKEVEGRVDGWPKASDLIDAGPATEAADVLMLLHREGVYGEPDAQRYGEADLIVADQPRGPLGAASLFYLEHQARFTDLRSPDGSHHPRTANPRA